MALQIGDVAPDFEADTTEGRVKFHSWLGDSWGVLVSHPKDFTPVCTTELGSWPASRTNSTSATPSSSASRWIASTTISGGSATSRMPPAMRSQYPMIGDRELTVAKLYGMIHPNARGEASQRTAADNATVRNVFIIGPDKKIKLIMVYPMSTGRNFEEILRVIDSLQLTAKHSVATPAQLEAGRGCDHRRLGVGRGCQEEIPARLEVAEALYPHRPAATVANCGSRPGSARPRRGRRSFTSSGGRAVLDLAA